MAAFSETSSRWALVRSLRNWGTDPMLRFGVLGLVWFGRHLWLHGGWKAINLNVVNFLFLTLAVLLHGTPARLTLFIAIERPNKLHLETFDFFNRPVAALVCDGERFGLKGVKLVVSDAHEGLKAAIARVLGATWQRCRVHFMRNLLATVPQGAREAIAAIVRTIFAQPDAASCRAAVLDRHAERRGTDERMLELLAPYAGHRARTIRLVEAAGIHPPRLGLSAGFPRAPGSFLSGSPSPATPRPPRTSAACRSA